MMPNTLFLLTLFFMGCKNPEKEIYIFPENFTGRVVIIFNIPEGVPKSYLNGHRVYEIPQNGILFTQFKSNPGTFKNGDIQYKMLHGNDSLQLIDHDIVNDTTSTTPQIFNVGLGEFGDKTRYNYVSFFVCTYLQRQTDFKESPEFITDDKRVLEIITQKLKKVL